MLTLKFIKVFSTEYNFTVARRVQCETSFETTQLFAFVTCDISNNELICNLNARNVEGIFAQLKK